jgi:hypothetical protein
VNDSQITRNNQTILSVTNISEIQEDHLKCQNIEGAATPYFYHPSSKFNLALLVSACQEVTRQSRLMFQTAKNLTLKS